MTNYTRRELIRVGLRSVSGLAAASTLARFGEMNAFAAGPNYKALVCIFLAGGNDGHNTVIPIATPAQNYNNYAALRPTLALPQNQLLPIAAKSGAETYGLHPRLTELAALYTQKKAAILANTGMLVQPTDRNSYLAKAPVPSQLFSHSDQTTAWQTASPSGIASTGWGGKLIDAVAAQNSGAVYPPIVNAGGCGLFCVGQQNLPTTVTSSGAIPISGVGTSMVRATALQQVLAFDNGLQLVQSANGILQTGSNYAGILNSLINSASNQQTFANLAFPAGNTLAAQLKMVARIINVQSQLGLNRQIFFCSLGGFDTHTTQLASQDMLLQQLSQAIDAFQKALVAIGADTQVTTFTTSEFGRTLQPNGSGGTDHAWGSHHFVIGSAVQGGELYGTFPTLAYANLTDATGRGALIPTTSVDQYGATLANWFGVPAAQFPGIFPNLSKFTQTNLGFLG